MCQAIVDILFCYRHGWRCCRDVCGIANIVARFTSAYDIAGDFLFWFSIRDIEEVPQQLRDFTLMFAIIGLSVDVLHGLSLAGNVFDDKDENRYKYYNGKLDTDAKFMMLAVLVESIPQLVLAISIASTVGKPWSWFTGPASITFWITVTGSAGSCIVGIAFPLYRLCVLNPMARAQKSTEVNFTFCYLNVFTYKEMLPEDATEAEITAFHKSFEHRRTDIGVVPFCRRIVHEDLSPEDDDVELS